MIGSQLPAHEADQIAKGKWFAGYTKTVERFEGEIRWESLDVQTRAAEGRGAEYLLVQGDLALEGDLDLGRDIHSIYVITGNVSARRVILGDAVLVVGGSITAREWVFGPRSEGLFAVAGNQIESKSKALLARISAPTVALYDRKKRDLRIVVDGVARSADALVLEVLDADEDDLILEEKVRARLEVGAPLLR